MNCKICDSDKVKVVYEDRIREGGVGKLTPEKIKMFECQRCRTIWHEELGKDYDCYYESETYRMELEGTSDIEDFYKLHDEENLQKLLYTTTKIFRNKIVADVGCGGGAFLDFIAGAASEIIGIEPSYKYRTQMSAKGYITYPYMKEAKERYADRVEVITSFDVIEHVGNPLEFLKDIYDLLAPNGKAIIGTPTGTPIMRELLGNVYEEFLFSTQHIWILSRESMELLAEKAGFHKFRVEYKQRYGLGNCISWLINKKPRGHISYDFISETMNQVWKNECNANGLSDYIVLYAEK